MVRGDDFTALAEPFHIQWLRQVLADKYELKYRGTLGPIATQGETTEITVLNKVICWTSRGIEFEADPRHAEIIIHELGLVGSRPVSTPGVKRAGEEGEPLSGVESTQFRALVARANSLSQDRVDISYAVKELTRHMSQPISNDMITLKRLGRYLVGKPRVVNCMHYQHVPSELNCWVDADWAGCVKTRRSTSGGGIKFGAHTIKTWTGTQASIALSSGASEYYALVKGVSQGLGTQS